MPFQPGKDHSLWKDGRRTGRGKRLGYVSEAMYERLRAAANLLEISMNEATVIALDCWLTEVEDESDYQPDRSGWEVED